MDSVEHLAREIVEHNQMELVDVVMARAGRKQSLQVYIYKPTGITIEDCSKISRQLGTRLDAEGTFQEPYTLEVSSPGLDRPLRKKRDYERNIGKSVRVRFKPDSQSAGEMVGQILGVSEDQQIQMDTGKKTIMFPIEAVAQAKLDIRV